MDPACWLKKGSRLSKSSTRRNFSVSPIWSTCGARLGVEQDQFPCVPQEPLRATVKRWKLAWFGHVTRHDSLPQTILQGTFEGGRRRGRQRKCWVDNIKEWATLPMPELLTRATCRKDWKRISAESSLVSPDGLIGQGTELNWTLFSYTNYQSETLLAVFVLFFWPACEFISLMTARMQLCTSANVWKFNIRMQPKSNAWRNECFRRHYCVP